MNNQTPGPLFASQSNALRLLGQDRQAFALIASCDDMQGDMIKPELYERENANARLVAAAYTSYDKAGRALGIDATALARLFHLCRT